VKRSATIVAVLGLVLPGAAEAAPRAAVVLRGTDFERPLIAASPRHGATLVARDKWPGDRILARHVSARGQRGPVRKLDASSDASAVPLVAVDSAGTATVLWFDDGRTLVARRMTAQGRLGPLVTVGPRETNGDSFRMASLGVDAAGNATIAWQRVFAVGGPHDTVDILSASVFVRRLNADGTLGPLLELEPGSGENRVPLVAVAASGRAIVAWDHYDGYGQSALRMATFESDGTLARLPDIFIGGVDDPALAIDTRGNAIAAWSRFGSVFARGLGMNGFGPVLPIGVDAVSSIEVAVGGSGIATVVWEVGNVGEYPNAIHARRVGPAGAQGSPLGIYDGVDRVKGLSVAVDPTGDATTTWTRVGLGPGRPRTYSVEALGIGAHLRLGTPRTLASRTRHFLSSPDVAADGRGTVTVAWAERLSRGRGKSVVRLARRVKPKRR
jgi:hypothetical protein